MHLHHVGLATDDADGLVTLFDDLLGLSIAHEERFDGLRLVFLDAAGAELELLEPVDGDGPVSRFLDRRGPGLHHLAFETDDIEAALETADELGLERIDERPRPGARDHMVAFLHPDSTGGVLVEFVEQ